MPVRKGIGLDHRERTVSSFIFVWRAKVIHFTADLGMRNIILHLCQPFYMQPITEIFPLLKEPRTIVIVMHQKPDADAMGSSLGLYHVLIALGHR